MIFKNKHYALLLFLWALISDAVHAQTLISKVAIARQRYDKYLLLTKEKDTVTFYLSKAGKSERLPLLVFVQGSGRFSLFNKDTLLNYGIRSLAGVVNKKARLLFIEKPGIGFLQGDPKSHDPTENKKFNQQFSLQSWCSNIESAITYTVKSGFADTTKIMVMGHSEGGLAAAKVAHDLGTLVTHVTVLAGEGPSQLYSLYSLARSGDFFQNDEHNKPEMERIDSLQSSWQDILKHPAATDKFFFGYTYLRWATFLSTSVLEELVEYNGKIFIAQGTADKNVAPESAVFLYTGLLSKGRNVKITLVNDADHSFYSSKIQDGWQKILNGALVWFLN